MGFTTDTRHATSRFSFYDDRPLANIDEELTSKPVHRSHSNPEKLPTLQEINAGYDYTHHTPQQPSNSNRLSRRLSLALLPTPKGPRHARKPSDLTELLCEAAAAGNVQVIGRILGAGGDLSKRNADGLTALHVAAMAGQGAAVRSLVRMGAPVDERDAHGYSALHRAVLAGRVALVPHLANLGADVEARDAQGRTGVLLAAEQARVVSAGRRASQPALRFSVAFSEARHRRVSNPERCGYDECGVMEALVRAGADVAARNREGETGLHVAVKMGNVENAQVLLDLGAPVNAVDGQGMTPLGVLAALDECNDALSSLLLTRGAEVTPIESKKRRSWFRKAAL